MKSVLQLVLYSSAVYFSLVFLGIGVMDLARFGRNGAPTRTSVSSFMVGLALVQLLGWWILDLTDHGVAELYSVLAVLAVVGIAGHLILHRRRLVGELRCLAEEHWIAVASILLFAVAWWPLLRSGPLTAVGANGDIASYAEIARHIESHGFADPGRIVGGDLGNVARVDVSGAYMALAFARGVIGRPYHQVLIPVLSVFVAVVAQQGRQMLRHLPGMTNIRSTIVCLVPQSTFMMVYLMGCYFLAQWVSMAALLALVASAVSVRSVLQSGDRLSVREVVLMAAAPMVLLASYPHMAFVVVPLVALAVTPLRNLQAFGRYAVAVVSAGVVTGALLLPKVVVGVDRFFKLAKDSANGWPLPSLVPSELLGFQSNENTVVGRNDLLASLIIVGCVIVALVAFRASGRSSQGLVPLFLLLSATCAWMAWSAPDTYRNWKWTTQFAPVLVMIALGVIVSLLKNRMAVTLVLVALAGLVPLNLSRSRDFMDLVANRTPKVTYELSTLGSLPELQGVEVLNVSTGDYLFSMWPAFFLAPRQVSILPPSYYSASAPAVAPTLVREDSDVRSDRLTRIGAGFALVGHPEGPTSASIEGFGSRIEEVRLPRRFLAGTKRVIEATVENSGSSVWLGSSGWQGSVNLGGRFLDPVSREVVAEAGRAPIVAFPDYFEPGEKRSVRMEVAPNVPAGDYLLEIGPVIENLAWAGDLSSNFAVTVLVTVR